MPFDAKDWPVHVEPTTPAPDLIDRAIALLEERGWCQNHTKDDDGRMCLVGSLIVAAQELNEWEGAALGWGDAFGVLGNLPIPCWTRWNDVPGRTKEQVIARLRHLKRQNEHEEF